MGWIGGVVQRWVALVGLAATVVGIVTFAISEHIALAWLAIAGLLLLVASLATELWRVHRRGVGGAHQPPGGGIPLHAPVEYQVVALRQVIPRVAETVNPFGLWELDETMKNAPRRHVDPLYEPLRSFEDGLDRLVELGELEQAGGAWRLPEGERRDDSPIQRAARWLRGLFPRHSESD